MTSNVTKEIKKLQNIQNTYDSIAAEFDITRYKPWPQTVEFVNELVNHSTVLDLGCGNGRNIKYLASVQRGFNIIGLDFSIPLLRIANKNLKQLGFDKNINYLFGDISSLPIQDNTIDSALCVATLHHLPTSKLRISALMELHRCLKHNGRAFISVWDFEQDKFKDELTRQLKEPAREGEFGDVFVPWKGKRGKTYQRYYHLFYQDELMKLIDQVNFRTKRSFRAADNYHAVVEKK